MVREFDHIELALPYGPEAGVLSLNEKSIVLEHYKPVRIASETSCCRETWVELSKVCKTGANQTSKTG